METHPRAGSTIPYPPPVAAPPLQEKVEAPAEVEKFPLFKALNYSVANFGASLFYGLFNFAMPLYLNTYKLEPWLIGLLANERSFVGAIVQPIVGRISDRTNTRLGKRRPFFLIGVPLVCLGLIILTFHPSFWEMIAIVAVLAFFLAVAWDPYMAMMADLFPTDQRGRVGGIVGLSTGLGNIVFLVIALALWKDQEYLVFGIVVVALIITWGYTFFTIKEPPVSPGAEAPKEKVGKPNPVQYVKTVMQYPEAAKYVLAIIFFWWGTGGVMPFITLFGVKALHAKDENEAFLLPLAATITTAAMAVPWGLLADKISKKAVMVFGMFSLGIVAIVGSQSQNMLQGVITMVFVGATNAAMTLINPMLTDLVPKKRMAEFVGLGSAVFSFAQPIGSVYAGLVVSLAGMMVAGDEAARMAFAYRWAFIAAGLMLLLGGFLLTRVHPERAKLDD